MTSGVREQHPLQQGLRHAEEYLSLILRQVREQHPLQQGLRP